MRCLTVSREIFWSGAMKNRIFYLIAFLVFLMLEILIGRYAGGFIRYSLGDVIVIPTLYCLIRIFTSALKKTLPFLIFIFACFVEFMQYIGICDILHIPQGSILRIIIGTTGLWSDIICYAAGMIIIYLYVIFSKEEKNHV